LFPHEIGFNVRSQVDVFLDNGYTMEEWQLLEETRKILQDNNFLFSATCVRVPTIKIRKSAALNMVQIAEEIHKKGWLKTKR
jgi:aspartate-semialdehyde dehydrogenase